MHGLDRFDNTRRYTVEPVISSLNLHGDLFGTRID
jgi:hypothetical protein